MSLRPAFMRALALAAALLLAPLCWGQARVSEATLKAALVFNFARYVEWPDRAFASRDAPLVMCLIGRDRFGSEFTALEGRRLQGRSVKVRSNLALEDSKGCHVAFIADASDRQLGVLLRAFAGQPVLTVGDSEGFIDHGGAIGIVPGDRRLEFDVNRVALDRARLKASSQLLKLAHAVRGPAN